MRYIRRIILIFLTPLPLLAQEAGVESDTIAFGLRAGIGFFGALAIIVFLAGFIIYITRLGTERREEGITIMEKGASVLIVVILAGGLLRWLES